jgi:predicted ATPase/DNA-binding NarL/FixJ family response regulator
MGTHNLPGHLASFIGREEELGKVARLVGSHRLVTLTGVGGCGKTRLAGRLCARIVDDWPDGIWWVDLGSVTDPAAVPRLVAATVGVLIEPVGDPVQALAAQLRHRRMLICLDTCEHLLEATATLTEQLLRRCEAVSILATSREPLGVAGESVWRVPSLKPDEAVRLFVDRANLAAPAVAVDDTMSEVAAVCARVDNIPLAVELAAPWVRVLSLGQILAGLDDCFRLLASGPRAAIPRHQALSASMAWSDALLDEQERTVLRRLAVFAGPFSLDAVAAVCEVRDALGMIGRLTDKSLVTVRDDGAEVRYALLDTVRQYNEEKLQAAGQLDAARDRHLDYFLSLVERAEPELDVDQDRWRRELNSHRDNINSALHWGLSVPDAARGRRLAAAMARHWFIRGQAQEGLAFLTRAADLDRDSRNALQGKLLCGIAMLGMLTGPLQWVGETAERARAIAEETGDDVTLARSVVMLAWPAFFTDFAACHDLCVRAYELATADPFTRDWSVVLRAYSLTTRDRHPEAVALSWQAFERSMPRGDRFVAGFARGVELWSALETGDVTEAVAIGEETMAIVEPLGDFFAVGTLTTNAAIAAGMSGDIAGARKLMDTIVQSIDDVPNADVVAFMLPPGLLHLWDGNLEDAVQWLDLGVARRPKHANDYWTATRCLPGMVGALRRLGRTTEATEHAAKAVALATQYGAPYLLAMALDEQAALLVSEDPGRAHDLYYEALAVRREHNLRTYMVESLDAIARLEAQARHHAAAVRILAASDAARALIGYPRPPVDLPAHEAFLDTLRAALPEDQFETLWRDGTATSLDDAVNALGRGRGPRSRPSVGWDSLTPTENDVVHALCAGLSNPEIASRLLMSRATVKAHLSHIYAKLGVANRTELATLAGRRAEPPLRD